MPNLANSNERLLERASRGDQRAFASIFERYHQRLYRYCAAIVGDPEDARDALQNTMVRILAALPGERRKLELEPWLYRIAHNEAIELVRRRRPSVELDPEEFPAGQGPEGSLEVRERLRRLVCDLRELPERQRGALVMRELGGLSFEQIGEAFETNSRGARQTVYEARVSLQEMEGGRSMPCDDVRRRLSDGDRRLIRRRDVRAHLRECARCRDFEREIRTRRSDLGAIAPLPALAAGSLLHSLLGGAGGVAAPGAGAAGAGAAGKVLGGSLLAKTVASAAVVTVIGVAAADRGGLIHVVPGEGTATSERSRSNPPSPPAEAAAPDVQPAATQSVRAGKGAGVAAPDAASGRHRERAAKQAASEQGGDRTSASPTVPGNSAERVSPGRGAGAANAHGANPKANPKAASKAEGPAAGGHEKSKPQAPAHAASPTRPSHPAHPKPESPAKGKAGGEVPEHSSAHGQGGEGAVE